MNVVLLGATRGMGRSLARAMAGRGDKLFIIGRNAEELDRTVADLNIRHLGSCAGADRCDLADPSTFEPALTAAAAALGRIECIVVTAALFGTQPDLEADLDRTLALLHVNFGNTIIFCEHARRLLLAGGGGTLCVFSSVAGDRARKPVILYGASKAGLSYYLEGLDHRYRADGLITVCVKPGFVKTGMTAGLDPPPFAGVPDAVARTVLRGIDKGKPVVYAPPIWALVMLVIRSLPRAVMRKIGF